MITQNSRMSLGNDLAKNLQPVEVRFIPPGSVLICGGRYGVSTGSGSDRVEGDLRL
jgi:hypothetical protein